MQLCPTPRVFGGGRRWDSEAANVIWEHFHALKPFFVIALTTGLRLGDLCRLTWKDVRWAEGWIQLVMEKTEREVVVPISAACEAALKECRARPVVGELVFIDEVGAPLSVTRIRRGFALAKKFAGITRKVRFHDLRHTYGSSLASDGLSLAIISKVMGHASQITTARYARPDTRVFNATTSFWVKAIPSSTTFGRGTTATGGAVSFRARRTSRTAPSSSTSHRSLRRRRRRTTALVSRQ